MQPQKERIFTAPFVLNTLASMAVGTYSIMLMSTVLLYGSASGLSGARAGLLASSFAFASLLFRPFSGLLADRLPMRALYWLGTGSFALGPLVFLCTRNFAVLVAVRTLQGVGMSLASTVNGALASALIPKRRFTEGIGYYGIGMALSSSVAPALGLWLINTFGYRGMFLGSSLLGLAAMLLLAGVPAPLRGPVPPLHTGEFVRGLYEKTALFAAFSLLLVTLAQVTLTQFLPLFLQEQGRAQAGAQGLYLVSALGVLAPRLGAGLIKRRLTDRQFLAAGYAVLAAGFLVLQLLPATGPLLLTAGLLYGLGNGSVQLVLNSMAVVDAPPERYGAANATYLAANDLGYGAAPVLGGAFTQAQGSGFLYAAAAAVTVFALGLHLLRQGRKENTS